MHTNRSTPLRALRAGAALLRGAVLLLLFRPGVCGQCKAQAPACLAFLQSARKRPE
jgi:hypothetical protein